MLELTAKTTTTRELNHAHDPTALDIMLCWNPGADVALIPWPDLTGASQRYECSTLACNAEFHKMTAEQRKLAVFVEAMHLIVRDKCDPQAVHGALLGLQEYRDGMAPDMPGL